MYRFSIFFVAFLMHMSLAISCSPAQATDILFSNNSSHISVEELLKLANFMIKINTMFPNHEILVINGTASSLEKNSLGLANARRLQIANYLRQTQYRGKFEIGAFRVWKLSDLRYTRTHGRGAEILFIPAPPHVCNKTP